jgi:hypothetical protein
MIRFLALLCLLLTINILLISWGTAGGNACSPSGAFTTIRSINETPEVLGDVSSQIDQIAKQIDALPNCALRSNLFAVIGMEYGGQSEILNHCIMPMIEIEIDSSAADE